MIQAFNFSCYRDLDLSNLMVKTLKKYGDIDTMVYNTDEMYREYGNGSGWGASMLKLDAFRELAKDINDNDFILSVDSDVVFTSSEVFQYVIPDYGIIGIQSQQPFKSKLGQFAHMSGALIFIRGDIAKQIAKTPKDDLELIRGDLKRYSITENEDIILSYLAVHNHATQFDLNYKSLTGNFEYDLVNKELKSFYHLNYIPTKFLDMPVNGKYYIPQILHIKGIEL